MNNTKKSSYIETTGTIIEALPNAIFKVKTEQSEIILAYISGKIRKNNIRILIGDKVIVQFSFYDKTKGRIVYRKKIENFIKKNE